MEGCTFVSPPVAAHAGRFNLREGDILIALTGYIGEVAIVKNCDLPAVLNQRVGLFSVLDRSRLDNGFLFQLLRSPGVRDSLKGLGYGSAQPNVSPTLIQSATIPLPPLAVQQSVARFLGTLDDKIELNRRMNETLEAMAQALFKSWFVDFDPVRAKLEGRWRRGQSLPGLPAEHYDLFPDQMVDSELGEIPEGWEVTELGKVTGAVGGTTPSTKVPSYWEGGSHCWATPKDLSTLPSPVLLETERKITDAGLQRIGSGLLPAGTLLLSSRAPIGYLAIAEVPVAVNQGFIAMPPEPGISNLFLLHWCAAFHELISNFANGSTFLEISKRDFRQIPIARPLASVMSAFDRVASALHTRLVSIERESRTLHDLRDSLLPRLISGEIRVADAEREVERVA